MKFDPRKALKVPLTPYEQAIEDAIDEKQPPIPVDSSTAEKYRVAARRTLRAMHGGARKGAGRKPRPHIRTTVLLAPAARAKLDAMARKKGSLSAAVESLIARA